MMTTGEKEKVQLELRLMVDKRKSQVVYAECDRFMADIFFSFLTTPVGTLVCRTGKDSGLGCMDSLYKSVEDMDARHFETLSCRDMLLRPRSAFGFAHRRLKIRINGVEDGFPYACPSLKCFNYSLFPGAKCECGRNMTSVMPLIIPPPGGNDEVFLRKNLAAKFVVTDNLLIFPSSDTFKSDICVLADVGSTSDLEEQVVFVDNDKIVQLMKLSLLSNTPLTHTFLPSTFITKPLRWPLSSLKQHFEETEDFRSWIINKLGQVLPRVLTPILGRKEMAITILCDKKKVVFARVEKDFVNILFSFLCFPFGSIIAAAGGRSSLGSLDNLHMLVKKFVSDGHFHGDYLLNPPIAHHHDFPNQLIKIGKQPFPVYYTNCELCDIDGIKIRCNNSEHAEFEWKPLNPKLRGKQTTKRGGGYLHSPETFLITNTLVVRPICDLEETDFATGLEAKSVIVGQNEVFKLMIASLLSKDPLTEVFLEGGMDYNYFDKKHL